MTSGPRDAPTPIRRSSGTPAVPQERRNGGDADVVVIGAGHNGLVAGAYLAKAGLEVTVVEAAPYAGGMTRTERSIAGAPDHVLHPCAVEFFLLQGSTVIADLGLEEAGLRLAYADPAYVHLDPDGPSVAFFRDPRRTADDIARLSRRDAAAYLDLVGTLAPLADIALRFVAVNPTRPPPAAVADVVARLARHPRWAARVAGLFRRPPLETLTERFEHPVVRNAVGMLLAAGGPLSATSTATTWLFLAFVHRLGICRPAGGMHHLTDALVARLTAWGGEVRTGAPVAEVLVEAGRNPGGRQRGGGEDAPQSSTAFRALGKADRERASSALRAMGSQRAGSSALRATGVRLENGEIISARRAVFASVDPQRLAADLLPDGAFPAGVSRRLSATPANAHRQGTLKVDLALSGQVRPTMHEKWRGDGLDLRIPTAVLGSVETLQRAHELAPVGRWSPDLPMWALVVSGLDSSLAPAGQDVMYLWSGWAPLAPAEGDAAFRSAGADTLLARASDVFDGLPAVEIGRRVSTSADIAREYRVTNGCITHIDLVPAHSGPLRPVRGLGGYRTPIDGLWLCGSGSHPGGGVSGLPGKLAATELLRRS